MKDYTAMSAPIPVQGVRKQEVLAVKDVPYSIKDKDTGKINSGVTRKICFAEYTDGELSGMYIAKAQAAFNPELKRIGTLGFDRFGKAYSFVVG